MLREAAHFMWHAPSTLALKFRSTQAELYEEVMGRADRAGLDAERAALVSGVRGDVLEIGVGTGKMLPHYPADARVTGLEPDASFAALAPKGIPIVIGSAESLPFPDASFDVVVSALVLCSVPDPARAVLELKRVLRKGGELRALEHVVSDKPISAALMRALDPLWLSLNGQGCHMARDTEALLASAFTIDERRAFQIFSPGLPAFPMRRLRCVL